MKFRRAIDAVLLTLVIDAGASVINAASRRVRGLPAEQTPKHPLSGLPAMHGAAVKEQAAKLAGADATAFRKAGCSV